MNKRTVASKIKRSISACASVLLVCALLCGCASGNGAGKTDSGSFYSSDTTEKEEITSGGTLRIPVNYSPATMHPLFVKQAQLRNVYSMIFEPLIELDDNSEPTSCIAESWSYSDGAWTIKLRANVHWHGGLGEITALDAAYTVNSILSNPDSVYYSNLSTYITSAEGYDTTLIIHAKSPSYALIYALNIPVIPESYYAGKDKSCMDIPRGSGCFSVDTLDFSNGLRMTLSSFSKWWKKLPYIEKVEVIGYKSSDEMLEAFSAGELDCVPTSLKTTEKYEILSGVNAQSYLSHNYVFLAFNTLRPYTSSESFRKAVAYAINRTAIINNVYLTKASGAEQPLFNDSSLSSTSVTMYDHNAARAASILEQLGYSDSDGNGYLEENGAEIALSLAVINVPENPVRLEAAEAICSQLKEVGINCSVSALTEDELKAATKTGSYDMIISGYYLSDTPNLRFAFEIGNGNMSFYTSDAISASLDEIDNAETLEALKKASFGLQDELANSLPQIGLLFEMNTFLYSEKLHISSIRRESRVYSTANFWYFG